MTLKQRINRTTGAAREYQYKKSAETSANVFRRNVGRAHMIARRNGVRGGLGIS